MKILIVTGIFPPDHGGPASYVPDIAQSLSLNHSIISVVTLSDEGDPRGQDFKYPVVRILRKNNKLIRRIKTIYTIHRLAKEADIIFVNGLIFESIIACKIFLRKLVITKIVGDLVWEKASNASIGRVSIEEFHDGYYGVKWGILKLFYKFFVKACDAIIVPSQYLCNIVSRWGIDVSKINVIHNAVKSITISNSSIDNCYAVDCVTVARLVPWKGIDELIDVVCDNGWTLNIIGDGPSKSKLISHARTYNNCSINFIGYLPKEEIPLQLAKSKIFILNSSYEGLPHIVLEAKQAGVAVIATAVGGTPEIIDDGKDGYLVPPGNKMILAERISYLLSHDDERKRIANNGKKQVQKYYSHDDMVRNTEKVFVNIKNRASSRYKL